ncbi:hypothetical protein IC744_11905 [Microbacterium hominis]|uniref:peptidoglycan-binding domain-containing protein n=1 Tax=Microbacterium TaxID=33882 RepID=UPI00168AC24F|nr:MULTISPECIES: peptidoglycan-binding domain-containing protein [Microbacterium]QOC26963.1 hypothetical protein IC745_06155 [Microbacterium hominis]QOC28125.1 hypothetical protein IC744_11905 [Microbacterium hominis]QYF96703.1 peptidoglycan-binding protein [Microbacterium sp. PAMC21962]
MVPTDSSEPTGDDASETRGSATGAIVRLRRVQHPGRIIAFVAVVIVMLAASFVAGAMLVAPEREAVDNATTRVDPTLFVEERVVVAELQLSAGVVAGASYDIVRGPEYLLGAERSVVSAMRVLPGDLIDYGTVVAEVSGRPVITVPAATPLYRDLQVGAEGADVRALQVMLADLDYRGVTVTGILDEGTIDAMRRLYTASGYQLSPDTEGKTIRWREFARIPVDHGTLVRAAEVGTVLDGETPLMTVQTAPPTLVARATLLEADRLTVGQEVMVSAGGGAPVSSTVLAIGEFSTDAVSGAGGKQISVALPPSLVADAGQPLTVRSRAPEPTGLAVPLVAVQTDDEGTFVREFRSAGERAAEAEEGLEESAAAAAEGRIAVEATAQAGGWVAVAPNDRLRVGMRLGMPE